MMSKNTGTSYEVITQMIFDSILNRDDVKIIDVKHNITLQGKETSHQIDVYWEFELGGIKHCAVVQTKDLGRRTTKGQLLEFKSVLNDLPNQPRGIFVTRTGYQKGALEVARANGILLYELRKPTENDERGRMRGVILNLFALLPYTSGISFIHDPDWMIREGIRLGLTEIPKMSLSLEPHETFLYDENGQEIISVKEFTDSFYPDTFQELASVRVDRKFDEQTFIKTGIAEFPRLKLNNIEATIRVDRMEEEEIVFDANDLVGYILKNISGGTEQLFDKNGKPLNEMA